MGEGQSSNHRRHILCVCTANVCRSPMAERLVAHALAAEEEPWRSIPVVSAGVSAMEGEPASANAIRALAKVGLDLKGHRSQPVSEALVYNSLAIFCMTESHLAILGSYFPGLGIPVRLMRAETGEAATAQIPDPFGMDLAAYEAARDSMVEALPSLVRFIKTLKPDSTAGDYTGG